MVTTGETSRLSGVWLRLALFAGLVLAAVGAAAVVDLPSVAEVRRLVDSAGAAAPLVFVALYIGFTLAPVPKNVLSAAAGLVFGLPLGTLLVFLGAMVGAVLSFVVGRMLGRGAVERLTGGRVAQVDAMLARHGLATMILLRLVALVPFTAINYAAGLTGIRLRDYTLGTAIGIVPGTVAFVALGTYGTSPLSWPFLTAVGVLVALSVVGVVAARRGWAGGAERVEGGR